MENKEEIEINGVAYIRKDSFKNESSCNDVFLVRTCNAGVHYGHLESYEHTPAGCVVKLVNSRRVWSWEGAASLSQLAMEGANKPDLCKIAMCVPSIILIGVVELIPLTAEAFKNLNNIPEWKV